ncbi:MAG: peptide MFS transporter [Nannocystaceae bacterium]|nr:peptide MFS transporter [Nannocystaceae bacterium]
MFKKHPRGLPVLFFTEMWERFGFYLLLGIFVLYMTDPADPKVPAMGGLGMSDRDASDIFGTYLALVYLTPFVGGLLADRVLGYGRAIIMGGILMGLGYCGLAIPGSGASFWISLLLIILGNGLFKPNISALVGNLYDKQERFRPYKEAGFNIFYMGINIGAFVCNFVAAVARNKIGWWAAFMSAGIGMFLGVLWFMAGRKHVAEGDEIKPTKPGDEPVARILGKVLGPAAAFALLGWFGVPAILGAKATVFGSHSNDAFLFACIPVVWFYVSLWRRAEGEDRERVGALLPIFGVVVVFWAVFHQNGSALTVWADRFTDRDMPASVASAAKTFDLVEEVDTTPRMVPKTDAHGVRELDAAGKPIEVEGPHPYFNNLPKEQWPPPEVKKPLFSTELFQSINAFFVVLLTPVVVAVWAWTARRNKEPSTPGKISIGLFVTALSTLVMVAATYATHNGLEKASWLWLCGTYAVITVGELCLSPMGLSLVSKLSPPRLTAVMMGGWFLSTSIGNKLSGILSGLLDAFEHKSGIFFINFAGALAASLAIAAMVPRMRGVMKRYVDK